MQPVAEVVLRFSWLGLLIICGALVGWALCRYGW